MKKIVIATFVLAGTVFAANAQEETKNSSATTTTTTVTTSTSEATQDGYVSIKVDELPDPVKKALDNQDFKGWIINAASYNKKEEKYLVELKNGADMKKVKFDAEGNALND